MMHWIYLHLRAIGHALRQLAGQPASTLLSALVVGIALSLPAGAFLLLDHLGTLARGLAVKPEISVFLETEVGVPQLEALQQRLRALPAIEGVRFVGRDEALQQLADSGLADVLVGLEDNPLPDAFVLSPMQSQPEQYEYLVSLLQDWPEVFHVQLDSAWVARLHALLELGRLLVVILAGLLGFALVIVTFNTIRLQILTQRAEIEVSRLLGATDPFIRRPFYWFGCVQGALGGVVALVTVWLGVLTLDDAVREVAQSYGLVFRLRGPDWSSTLAMLVLAAALGWMGAALSVRKHLAAA